MAIRDLGRLHTPKLFETSHALLGDLAGDFDFIFDRLYVATRRLTL